MNKTNRGYVNKNILYVPYSLLFEGFTDVYIPFNSIKYITDVYDRGEEYKTRRFTIDIYCKDNEPPFKLGFATIEQAEGYLNRRYLKFFNDECFDD